jgi:uncharacterized damage-inducible protein DinB
MRLIRTLSAIALLVPLTSVAAQDTPPAGQRPATTVTESFRGISALFGGRLVAAFASIPADRYGYAPTPAQQTVGYVAQHLVDANYALCERFGGRPRARTANDGLADTVKAKWPKDTLVAQLRASFAFCATAMSNVDDAHLAEDAPIPGAGPGVTQQRARSLLLFVTDLAEHYAQLASYMRLLGMVPPSSVSPVKRVAIELPVSVLSRYVGSYDVPSSRQFGSPALHLDVTVRDGALMVKPAGQPEARLWPASETDFFLKVSPATVTFTRDAAGAVTGLVVHDNGEDRPGRKIR